ncbi:hypothetical protein Tco_0394854 [Tanacetum coccineum]
MDHKRTPHAPSRKTRTFLENDEDRGDIDASPIQIDHRGKFIQQQPPQEDVNFNRDATIPTSSSGINLRDMGIDQRASRSD